MEGKTGRLKFWTDIERISKMREKKNVIRRESDTNMFKYISYLFTTSG